MSDCTTLLHDTSAVYVMQKLIMPEIKKACPKVKKIIYVSDGAKQHYKNKYQMSNFVECYSAIIPKFSSWCEENFGIIAEWHFYATAHGKGACDGVGAILKREATRASLQAKTDDAILTSQSLFDWAEKKFRNIQFFYYSENQHARVKKFLQKRFFAATRVTKISCVIWTCVFRTTWKKLQVMKHSTSTEPISIIQYWWSYNSVSHNWLNNNFTDSCYIE